MMNCQEATQQVSASMDRPLGLAGRLRLGMHLLLCEPCRNFRRQLTFLRRTARQGIAAKADKQP